MEAIVSGEAGGALRQGKFQPDMLARFKTVLSLSLRALKTVLPVEEARHVDALLAKLRSSKRGTGSRKRSATQGARTAQRQRAASQPREAALPARRSTSKGKTKASPQAGAARRTPRRTARNKP